MSHFRKALTIAVYRVDAGTGKRTVVRPKEEFPPAKTAEGSLFWPPCLCPQHRDHNS